MKNIITNKTTLVFATTNKNKIREIKSFLPNSIKILSLSDIGCENKIEETGKTISENALIKSKYIKNNYGYNCFSDDTGLEINQLNGEPGVFSARYAGENSSSIDNINLILKKMKSINDRSAYFKTCISLIIDSDYKLFKGTVKGEITSSSIGEQGFGYDSIFKPYNSNKTFAQLSLIKKNEISHRGIALKKLTNYLIKIYP